MNGASKNTSENIATTEEHKSIFQNGPQTDLVPYS